jgi:pimeloyl-ACP methyl ester carboxylesterase
VATRRIARGVVVLMGGAAAACASSTALAASNDQNRAFARQIDIGDRTMYVRCAGTAGSGEPTIVLVSGYHDSSDVWTQSDLLTPVGSAKGPPVFPALARDHRVCTYDRPGTIRYIQGTPLTRRSTEVAQPRTAADVVEELHATLRAARVAGPYVLVGHSMGGLFSLLYARTYPDEVRAVVFNDAFSPTVPGVLGPLWPLYRDDVLNPPLDQASVPSLRSPSAERIDLDASVAEVDAAAPLPAMPLVVLTKTESFAGLNQMALPAGLTADELNDRYEQAEDALVAMALGTLRSSPPAAIITSSSHNPIWSSRRPSSCSIDSATEARSSRMTDKSFFSDDEWKALSEAPLHVTLAVVAVAEHGPISVIKEAAASAKLLAQPGDRGPATELVAAIAHDAQGHDVRHDAKPSRGASPEQAVDQAIADLAPATAALAKLPLEEAIEVRSWLLDLAHAVAEAAKGTNPREDATIERIRVALGGPAAEG